ncbi:rhodanese-like domain-containing protein [Streptomyces collinus]|uniref:Rhodanese-related sulfurtransferase n=1 Tax=Streptomyces collinus TaxID=42684 RepID=A0AA89U1K0_STRCU|nr:rhodanese-like domain-containing protein [Streptomyces collinus]MBB5815653.1 rhodanese-related sulfurtransferase [Streptomyces collinus]WMX68546.1 rhodanese-like domain-containing protein [Streptomyces collinus]
MSPFFRRGSGRVTPEQAHRLVADGQAVLLDVRETQEWNAGHAPGALHLPLTQLMAGAPLPTTVRGRRVVAICRSGNRSRTAADFLAAVGVEATDVTGGMTAWARQGLPVTGVNGSGGVIA